MDMGTGGSRKRKAYTMRVKWTAIIVHTIYRKFITLVRQVFPVLLCLSVSVKWLAVKTASEMTHTVSGGALNSAQPQPQRQVGNVLIEAGGFY